MVHISSSTTFKHLSLIAASDTSFISPITSTISFNSAFSISTCSNTSGDTALSISIFPIF